MQPPSTPQKATGSMLSESKARQRDAPTESQDEVKVLMTKSNTYKSDRSAYLTPAGVIKRQSLV